ncbi:prepilin-type N-terminal cleavage/methylation domain-containing protein [Botrimarina sp.]|uniref:prepilin-type N-terminal cleavage/methylation domain-containing protein n=1 Tax=Botrimarina sp. TaxID=2795802 RepID=UPI0032EA98EA
MSRRRQPAGRGFTLLEVILALAILGLALATLGHAVGRSHENARRVADESELTQIAASVVDEVAAGVRALTPAAGLPIADPDDPAAPPRAVVSIAIETTPFQGLQAVRVRASTPEGNAADLLDSVELVRWMLDPSLTQSTTEAEL